MCGFIAHVVYARLFVLYGHCACVCVVCFINTHLVCVCCAVGLLPPLSHRPTPPLTSHWKVHRKREGSGQEGGNADDIPRIQESRSDQPRESPAPLYTATAYTEGLDDVPRAELTLRQGFRCFQGNSDFTNADG